MGNGSCQLYMSKPFSSDCGLCDLDSASVAYNALISDLFVLSAVAFPILCRTEYPLAVKSVLFRLKGTVVYGLRLSDLAM